jgi:peptide/nickel transport system substrate-binding protein
MMMWGGGGTGYFDARNIGWAMVDQAEFQGLVDQLLKTTDPQETRKLMAQVQQFYARELPAIPLYWNRLLQPYNARYEGWKVNPMYGFLWDESWYNLRKVGD